MKCRHCGNEIDHVKVHRFDCFGNDRETLEPILGGEENTAYYLDIDKGATMFEFDECYEEFTNHIICPKCEKFPFEGSIEIFERAQVVFGLSKDEVIE